jgi:hypothetical protein
MEGLAASVLLIAILLGVLFTAGGIVYLLAQRWPKQTPVPRKKPGKKTGIRWIGMAWVALFLLIIGLWAGINAASNPHPPAQPLNCPTGAIYAPLQGLCGQL